MELKTSKTSLLFAFGLWITLTSLGALAAPVESHIPKETKRFLQALCQAHYPSTESYEPLVIDNQPGVLEQVHLFIRHGDRTPLAYIPRPGLERQVEWECSRPSRMSTQVLDKNNNFAAFHLQVVTPSDTSLFHPYSESLWRGSCVPGQLTLRGAEQQQALGQALRDVYVDKLKFLPEVLNASLVYSRSSNVW
jgi:acid phosphatase